ncbi:killer cell lectin-like receptor subfamily B member 1B allele C isoform X1 [Rhinatrema bivittatum]|uniref:killer cell lectin-like receptor subfamily B member 1B allele C isoform X1 n=1 Tax=Rhinatrema bivittatum TaxID=194408 RepID=UPI001127B969|nr:killer cell lectin-like receptor subfamily B member 1B allele C isoform X1 [Rhinatrema bivittatum]XP_029438831.1 killer cell lectin-like receptor subfamily B member 1B allele C isoform X1 [Rhinatrema bivittatum]
MAEEVTYADLSFPSTIQDKGKYGPAHTQGRPDIHKNEHLEKATAVQHRSSFLTWIIILLGILCILLLILSIALGVLYAEKEDTPVEDAAPERINGDFLQNEGRRYEYCPEGWRAWKGDCYFASTESGSWIASLHDCVSRGAHLALLRNLEDLVLMEISRNKKYWIGLHKINNIWIWLDGTELGSSRSGNSLFCAAVTPQAEFSDEDCRARYPWICQKAAVELRFEQGSAFPVVSVNGVKHYNVTEEAA